MPDFKSIFAKGLRVCMAEADMKPPQLAEKSTVSVDAIRKYLRGEMAPTLETTCKLAAALGCSPNNLCSFDSVKGD